MFKNVARVLVALAVITIGVFAWPDGSSGEQPAVNTNPNTAEYWEAYLDDLGVVAECFKTDTGTPGQYGHGFIGTALNGKTYVQLYEFNQDWFGDHWALLVVKGGSDNNGGGDAVYLNPSAGVQYFAPTNPNNNKPFDVSHFIVCKGDTPDETTTTTVPEETTTTTEPEETTTTTVPEETTTTTVPEETTTTTEPEETTTTTEPEETTTTTEPEETTTTSTPDETTSTTEPDGGTFRSQGQGDLPRTGDDSSGLVVAGVALALGGAAITAAVAARRRSQRLT